MTLDDFEIIDTIPRYGNIICNHSSLYKKTIVDILKQLLTNTYNLSSKCFIYKPDDYEFDIEDNIRITWHTGRTTENSGIWLGTYRDYTVKNDEYYKLTDFLKIKENSVNRAIFYSSNFGL